MKIRFFKRITSLGLTVILLFSSFVFASAENTIKLTTVYGSTLADVVLPAGYSWVAENPETVSVGNAGNKSFPAKTFDGNGETVNVPVEVTVEQAYISAVYAATDSSLYYSGKPVIPKIKAYFNGKELVENVDYQLISSDNINIGTAKITVEGIGNFKGKTSLYFSIIKNDVEGINLYPTQVELVPGKTVNLDAEIVTDEATFKGITWNSSNSGIASVDESGIVTAVSEGIAVITATTNDGGYTADCTVNVVIHDKESTHKYKIVSSTEAGCETEGSVTYKCSVCEHEKTEKIPMTGHCFDVCYESEHKGLHVLCCSVCNKEINQTHTYSDWDSNGDATLFKNGTKTRKCIYCGFSETVPEENSYIIFRIISVIYETCNRIMAAVTEFINIHLNI